MMSDGAFCCHPPLTSCLWGSGSLTLPRPLPALLIRPGRDTRGIQAALSQDHSGERDVPPLQTPDDDDQQSRQGDGPQGEQEVCHTAPEELIVDHALELLGILALVVVARVRTHLCHQQTCANREQETDERDNNHDLGG